MSLGSFFGFGVGLSSISQDSELPEIYSLSLGMDLFVKTDMLNTYVKILTDTIERMQGLPSELEPLLWDNCVQNESSKGLITLLAEAMTEMSDLFLVYSSSARIVRKATYEEREKIRSDYKRDGKSSVGVYISFSNYRRSEILKIYSEIEYCVLNSLNKLTNLSNAVQVKISDLRGSVSLNDSSIAIAQAKSIANALSRGKSVMLDVKDEIMTAILDTSPTTKAIEFLDSKRAFYYSFPMSYISGIQTPGIGSTGEADMRAVERGLKQYFVSIVRPTVKAVFDKDVEFKSQDFRQITSALDALRTFQLSDDTLITLEKKRDILARLFEFDLDEEDFDQIDREIQARLNSDPPQQPEGK